MSPRQAPARSRVYVDIGELTKLHPAAGALFELEAQILLLSAASEPEAHLPTLAAPPRVSPAPTSVTTEASDEALSLLEQVRQVGEKNLEALQRELDEAVVRKLAVRRAELNTELAREMRTEQAQLQEPLWQEEEAIFKRNRRSLFNLRAALEREDLSDEERSRLEEELAAVEAKQARDLAAVRQAMQVRLAEIRNKKTAELEEALLRYEFDLRVEDAEIVAQRRAKMEADLSAAAMRLQQSRIEQKEVNGEIATEDLIPSEEDFSRSLRAHRHGAEGTLQAVQGTISEETVKLQAAQKRLKDALREEVQAALEQIGIEHNVEFVYFPEEASELSDYTAQAAGWLKEYWKIPQQTITED